MDYAAAPGTPIIAPADGVISAAETQNGYGKVITLRHNARLSTLYAHMQRFAPGVKTGKPVRAGDVLGYVGSSGRVTGPHLHFEVKLNGQAVDPATAALPAPGLTDAQRVAFAQLSRQLSDKLALLRDTPGMIAQLD
ncbi:M23 family metallopeptidase [Aquitalea magnusonii]|uniref:M23 family metallopeptidase n=1 Tax=Aquitalea magnusonii TaxID=332411 RepID=UPI001EFAFDB1|nr:M23 family metallopeptidase [Aquitalea magnusonii]